MVWGRWFSKPKVGETSPAPSTPEAVLIEFECQEEGCEFVTLSLTDAANHIAQTGYPPKTRWDHRSHRIEPRGYLYPPKDPEEPK